MTASPPLITPALIVVPRSGAASGRALTIASHSSAIALTPGIACAIVSLRRLGSERLPIRIVILLSPDEETGSATSRERILAQALSACWVLVLEPPLPDGALKTARRSAVPAGQTVS